MVRIAFGGGEEGDAGRAGERGHVHRAGIVADDEDGGFGERDDLEKVRTRHKAFDARLALDDFLGDLAFGGAADDRGLDAGVSDAFGEGGIVLHRPALGLAVLRGAGDQQHVGRRQIEIGRVQARRVAELGAHPAEVRERRAASEPAAGRRNARDLKLFGQPVDRVHAAAGRVVVEEGGLLVVAGPERRLAAALQGGEIVLGAAAGLEVVDDVVLRLADALDEGGGRLQAFRAAIGLDRVHVGADLGELLEGRRRQQRYAGGGVELADGPHGAQRQHKISEGAELDDQHVLCLCARVCRTGGFGPRRVQVLEFPYSNRRL